MLMITAASDTHWTNLRVSICSSEVPAALFQVDDMSTLQSLSTLKAYSSRDSPPLQYFQFSVCSLANLRTEARHRIP